MKVQNVSCWLVTGQLGSNISIQKYEAEGFKNLVKIRSVTAISLNKSNEHIHKDYQDS